MVHAITQALGWLKRLPKSLLTVVIVVVTNRR